MQVVVYSKLGCPFCSLLKMELRNRAIPFSEIDLTDDSLRREFYDKTGTNTVPQVFLLDDAADRTDLSGRRIGGYTEVKQDWSVFDA